MCLARVPLRCEASDPPGSWALAGAAAVSERCGTAACRQAAASFSQAAAGWMGRWRCQRRNHDVGPQTYRSGACDIWQKCARTLGPHGDAAHDSKVGRQRQRGLRHVEDDPVHLEDLQSRRWAAASGLRSSCVPPPLRPQRCQAAWLALLASPTRTLMTGLRLKMPSSSGVVMVRPGPTTTLKWHRFTSDTCVPRQRARNCHAAIAMLPVVKTRIRNAARR